MNTSSPITYFGIKAIRSRQVYAADIRAIANTIPNSSRDDLQTLRDQLIEIREGRLEGQGPYPMVYKIAEGMLLNTEPAFLQNWEPTYPDDHEVH